MAVSKEDILETIGNMTVLEIVDDREHDRP